MTSENQQPEEPQADATLVELAQAETASNTNGRRPLLRWALLLLALGLASVGYVTRARWFKPSAQQVSPSAERKVLYWVDPMHPAYKSDKPGTAPDCGMDLVPVYEGGQPSVTNFPAGTVQISPERQQLIGVQYGQAEYRHIAKTLRTVGRVMYDETRVTHVHTKYEGWIEEVFVDFTGKLVSKGQPLLSIYSPELLQTQQEFLLARRGRAELSESPFREAAFGAHSLYEAARKRLELWDLTETQITELERGGKPARAMALLAPNSGFVTTRNAFQKQRVTPETELYTLADLSNVWIVADVYESEAPEVKVGQSAAVTLSYFPGRVFRGKVTYIYPQLDNTTRTLKARVEVANPGFVLKPDMYANVELRIDYGQRVIVPQAAVLDSGAEQQVFVAHDGGYFEPRRVTLGAKVASDVIILGGLKADELIVTSANFLIDSESKLKSATGGMGAPGGHEHGATSPPATNHSQHPPNAPAPSPTIDHSKHSPTTAPEDHSSHARAAAEHDHAKAKGKVLYYYCTMHPEQRSQQPADCPKCKMRLVPKHAGAPERTGNDD